MARLITRGDTLKNFGEYLPTPVIEKVIIKSDIEADFKIAVYMNASEDPDDAADEEIFKRLRDLKFYLYGIGKNMPATDSERGDMTNFEDFDSYLEFLSTPDTVHGYTPVSQLVRASYSTATSAYGVHDERFAELYGDDVEADLTLKNYLSFKFSEFEPVTEELFTDEGFRIIKYSITINSRDYNLGIPASLSTGTGAVDWYAYFTFCTNYEDINKALYTSATIMTEIPPMRRLLDDDVKPEARVSDHPYYTMKQSDINAGDITYLVFIENGAVGGRPRPVWVDAITEAPYNETPLQEIAGVYHRSSPTTHQDIVTDFQTLVTLYREEESYAGHMRLHRQLDGISRILSIHQMRPDLIPQLRFAIRAFPDKSSATEIGRLYTRLSRKLYNANKAVRANRRVIKKLMYDTVIVDERTTQLMAEGGDTIISYTGADSAMSSGASVLRPGGILHAGVSSLMMTRRTLIAARDRSTLEDFSFRSFGSLSSWAYDHGDYAETSRMAPGFAGTMAWDALWYEYSTMSGDDYIDTEWLARFNGVDDDKWGMAGVYNGYFFVDLDYYHHYQSNLSRIFNVSKIELWFGPWLINGGVLMTHVHQERYNSHPGPDLDDPSGGPIVSSAESSHGTPPTNRAENHISTNVLYFDHSGGFPKPSWGKYHMWKSQQAFPSLYLFQAQGSIAAETGEEDPAGWYSQRAVEEGQSFLGTAAPGDGSEMWGAQADDHISSIKTSIRLRNFTGGFDVSGEYGNFETRDPDASRWELTPRTGFRNYRLAAFQYTELMGAGDAMNDNAWMCTQVGLYDRSYAIGRVLVEEFLKALEDFRAYYEVALQECSYNNLDDRFNDFFIRAVMEEWGDRMEEAPWVVAATLYYIHLDILFDTFEGNKELLVMAAKGLADQLSPAGASLSQLEAFMGVMQGLYDSHYGFGSPIDLHLNWDEHVGDGFLVKSRKNLSDAGEGYYGAVGEFDYAGEATGGIFPQLDPKMIKYRTCTNAGDLGECINLTGWQEMPEAHTEEPSSGGVDATVEEAPGIITVTATGIDWEAVQRGLDVIESEPPIITDSRDALEWQDDIHDALTDIIGSTGYDWRDWIRQDWVGALQDWWMMRTGSTFPPDWMDSWMDTGSGSGMIDWVMDIHTWMYDYASSGYMSHAGNMESMVDMFVGEFMDPKCSVTPAYDSALGVNIDRWSGMVATFAVTHFDVNVWSYASAYSAATSYYALDNKTSTSAYATEVYNSWGCASGFSTPISSYLSYMEDATAVSYASYMTDFLG
tara:strand:+ start:12286 stop:16080 length:3795 start_codon:yes stop_codon:yes gene_type:complete